MNVMTTSKPIDILIDAERVILDPSSSKGEVDAAVARVIATKDVDCIKALRRTLQHEAHHHHEEPVHKAEQPEPSVFTSKDWKTPYKAFLKEWEKVAGSDSYGEVEGLPLVKLVTEGEKHLTIISGVHGEEQVGPLTVLERLPDILKYAKEKGVGLNIYPLYNPTGWGRGKRNIKDGTPSNHLIEYRVKGKWVLEVADRRYDDVRVAPDASDEAKAFYEDIISIPTPDAMVDLHQDSDLDKKDLPPSTYAYVFDDQLREVAKKAAEILPAAAGQKVELYDVEGNKGTVDPDGLLICKDIDNTTQGVFEHLGCPLTVTVETSLTADKAKVDEVNLTWIYGLIDSIAESDDSLEKGAIRNGVIGALALGMATAGGLAGAKAGSGVGSLTQAKHWSQVNARHAHEVEPTRAIFDRNASKLPGIKLTTPADLRAPTTPKEEARWAKFKTSVKMSPFSIPSEGHIFANDTAHPSAVSHEAGHILDPNPPAPGTIANTLSGATLESEKRAWDHAPMPVDPEMREAALSTYEGAQTGSRVGFGLGAVGLGIAGGIAAAGAIPRRRRLPGQLPPAPDSTRKSERLRKMPLEYPSWPDNEARYQAEDARPGTPDTYIDTHPLGEGRWVHHYRDSEDEGDIPWSRFNVTATDVPTHIEERPTIATLRGISNRTGMTIFNTVVHPKFQRQGVATALYRHLASRFGTVWSDTTNSPESYALWDSLETQPDLKVQQGTPGKPDRHSLQMAPASPNKTKKSEQLLGLDPEAGKLESWEIIQASRQLGHDPDLDRLVSAAIFLAAGRPFDHDQYQIAYRVLGDKKKAVLFAVQLADNEQNLRALEAVLELGGRDLGKAEEEKHWVKTVTPAVLEARDTALEVGRAAKEGLVWPLNLNGKHSKGALAARDPKSGGIWLLKPGSGKLSPAAGVRQETASQSAREAAAYHIAKEMGLGQSIPHCDLLLINGRETAAMRLLGAQFKPLDEQNRQAEQLASEVLIPYLKSGLLHRLACYLWVIGETDAHGQNILVEPAGAIALIDHGSAFAGTDYSPGTDPSSFVPYILRAWAPLDFMKMAPEDRLVYMPKLAGQDDIDLREWLLDLNENVIEKTLRLYGVGTECPMTRLRQLRDIHGNLSEGMNKLWSGC
jgi:GNAT superfamily N-acetyltransferase